MGEPAAWDILHDSLHADCTVFKVHRQRCKHPHDSREGDFFVIRCADWVLALPVTRDGRLVLVRQFRFGTRSLSWEPPGGVLDAGEEPLAAARRETREETGYTAARARVLGHCSPNPAILGNRAHFVLLEDCEPGAPVDLDPNEEVEVGLFTADEAVRMILDGRMHHAIAVNALFHLRAARPDLFGAERGARGAE